MPIRAARPCPRCKALTFRWDRSRHGVCTGCGYREDGHQGVAPGDRGYGAAWRQIRQLVLERDCHVCQLQLPGCTRIATTVDHWIPRTRGGSTDPSNLVAACKPCNSKKQDKLI